jgi:type 2 lantibiotic biosynthesis protein LanM
LAGFAASNQALERGRKRLAKWKAQPPFDSGEFFHQRLGNLTESRLLEILCDGSTSALPGQGEPPGWATELTRALSESPAAGASLFAEQAKERPQVLFLELIQPLVAKALDRLRDGVGKLALSERGTPEGFVRLCHAHLPSRLLEVLARTMTLELNVARVQGLLQGETSEERFASYIARLQQPVVRLEFFREYPVLGRLVMRALDDWVASSLELLQRWCSDFPTIRDALSPEADPGQLVSIDADFGDRHRGGRTVCILECSSGFKVVYKPKSMAVDSKYQQLLGWVNDHDFSAPYRQLKILDRGNYGWVEFVSPQTCSSREEVARYYERTGGHLALVYALAATDFHYENVLAVGEHPFLIDLEALFHSVGLESAHAQTGQAAERSFIESVLDSGLLPIPSWSGNEAGAADLSALGAETGRRLPGRAPSWKGKGTDEMQFVREAQVLESNSHCPSINGTAASPLDYFDEMERGFRQVYQLLENHRDEFLARGGMIESFADDEVRVVLRSSSQYGELLVEGTHPDVLRDALDRDRLFDRLWMDVQDRPLLARLIPLEIEDLWRGDIPLLTTRPRSRDLWASADRCIPGVLKESGLERVQQRFAQLDAEDLKRQLWFLRASLSTLASARRPVAQSRSEEFAGPEVAFDRAQFLAASCAVGDRLLETALQGSREVSWIGLNLVHQKQWVLAPLGLDLYDGLPGIALFLAYLGSASGKSQYTAIARAALETVMRRVNSRQRGKSLGEIGVFVGWGGLIYLLAHLGMLWDEPALLNEAGELAELLPERIGKDKNLDIISGAAGSIMALLCLQSCQPRDRLVEIATQCGEHLLSCAAQMPHGLGWVPAFDSQAPLTGFSHGAAGISWALLELAERTCQERFRSAARGGIEYERSLFRPDTGNWPDLREPEASANSTGEKALPPMVAWCHGAPGIGLARLLCRRLQPDLKIDEEIEVALCTTVTKGFGHGHCLCHGDLGNLELLTEAGIAWPDASWARESNRLAASILQTINRDGWRCANPLAVQSPGLMTGLAGIGYGLLRCAEPLTVPSVLCLAPPAKSRRATV